MYGRSLAITTAAIALIGGIALPASATAPKAPPGTKAVTGTGTGTRHDLLGLLAGSDSELLYVSQAAWAGDLNTDPDNEVSSATRELLLRDINGDVHDLGVAPDIARFSTEGSIVTALRWANGSYLGVVDVWSVDGNKVTHRTVKVPTSVTFVEATPSGFAYADGDTVRAWDYATQTVTSLGVPFPSQTVTTLQTSQRNLVVTGSTSGVAVMSYAQPGTYSPLNIGTQTGPAFCDDLDDVGASCGEDGGPGAMFVPLDGSAPTVSTGGGIDTAMSGTHILYTTDDSDTTHLWSFSAGHPTVIRSAGIVNFRLVSAYGKALFLPYGDPSNHHVLEATSADAIGNAFTVSLSPDTAGPFAMTGSRIAYVSDLRDPHHPNQPSRVRSIDARATSSHVALTTSRDVGRGHGNVQIYPGTIAASGDTTAYVLVEYKNLMPYSHLVVRSGSHTVQLPDTFPVYGEVQAAGRLVAFTGRSYIGLYDVRSGHLRKLLRRNVPASWALTPTHLAYADDVRGAVKWLDLATGKSMTVYRRPNGKFAALNVAANGNRVSWYLTRNGRSDITGLRTMPSGPIVHLDHEVYGMTSAGMLMHSPRATTGLYTTWFQPYGGTPHLLLSARSFDELPQLVGHALAWVSVDGNLKVAPYSY